MAEPEFSMLAFSCAMLSNVLFAARGTFAKIVMKEVSFFLSFSFFLSLFAARGTLAKMVLKEVSFWCGM